MKIVIKVFFVIILFLSPGKICLGQVESLQDETQDLKLKKTGTTSDTKEQVVKDFNNRKTGNIENKSGSVKQVRSARPDMSRSRGARPPDIVRPSGSRIPRGLGRPAGAGRHGRG